MTENNKKDRIPQKPFSTFHLEADRCSSGMCTFISCVVGISELSEEAVLLKSHSGRISIKGKRLRICIFENNTVEVKGKIEEVGFVYGKA
jgi:hypothetical protein